MEAIDGPRPLQLWTPSPTPEFRSLDTVMGEQEAELESDDEMRRINGGIYTLRELNLKSSWREREALESDNEDADGYSVSSSSDTGAASDLDSSYDSDWDCTLDDEKRKPLQPIKAVSLSRWPIIQPYLRTQGTLLVLQSRLTLNFRRTYKGVKRQAKPGNIVYVSSEDPISGATGRAGRFGVLLDIRQRTVDGEQSLDPKDRQMRVMYLYTYDWLHTAITRFPSMLGNRGPLLRHKLSIISRHDGPTTLLGNKSAWLPVDHLLCVPTRAELTHIQNIKVCNTHYLCVRRDKRDTVDTYKIEPYFRDVRPITESQFD